MQESKAPPGPEGKDFAVFPGAGSFGSELRPLLRGLGSGAGLIRYPGRFGADFGRPADSFEDLVRSCVGQFNQRRSERPVLIGHSFGAYTAYATAARLTEAGRNVDALVVVGATAPALLEVPATATRDRAGTAAYLREIEPDLVPLDVSDEWWEIVVDTAWSDLRLLSEFSRSECGRVRCPILAACGESDPLTSDRGIAQWASATTSDSTARVFAGSHSDLLRAPEFGEWLIKMVS